MKTQILVDFVLELTIKILKGDTPVMSLQSLMNKGYKHF